MAKINFVGIINESDSRKYTKSNLNEKAVKLNIPKGNIQILSLPFLILPMVICFMCMFLKTFLYKKMVA